MIFKQETFKGGIAEGSKVGYAGSVQDMIGCDYRSDPDKLTALKKLKKDSGSTVTDLIKWGVENEGDYWFYGNAGKIYKRTSAGVWTNPKTVSNSTGQGLLVFNSINEDALWYASSNQIGRATLLTGSTEFEDNYFKSNTSEVDQSAETSGSTYTTPTSISEAAADRRSFVPAVDNLTGVCFVFDTKGTGDITFTVHDSSNNRIAEKVFTNAELPAGAFPIRVDFTGKFDITIGATYHVHITSTVADARVYTTALNDLSGAVYSTLYFYNDKDVDLRNDLSGTPAITNTYGLLTIGSNAVSEKDIDKCPFEPNKSSLAAISLQFDTQGTNNITLVVHDALDKLVGSVTITDAAFGTGSRRGGFHRFEFTTPLKIIPGGSYHFHVYASGAGSSLVTSTNGDLSTVSYLTHFSVLSADTDFHMMKEFGNLMVIGNGQYLATVDDSEVFDPERLTFLKGEKVRAIEIIGSQLVMATWKGSTIGSYGQSRLYFWDGVSPTFTDSIPVYGQVHALVNDSNNRLLVIHGTEGFISLYTGAITPLRRLKGIGENKSIDIYPGAVTLWNRLVCLGITGGNSTTVDRLVWTYGTLDKDYPETLNKDYPISTGSKGSTVQIGMLLGVNADTFFVSWKDGSNYGVDIIDTANDQLALTTTLLRFDSDAPNKQKTSTGISIRCSPLAATDTITLSYKLNNTGSFTQLFAWAGSQSEFLNMVSASYEFVKNWYEIEWKIDMTTSSTTMPDLISLSMDYEMNDNIHLGTTIANDNS